jgi:signal transduction histidine kinase
LITRNGSEIPIDDSAAPIEDDRGNIIGVVLIFRDVTERKCKEKELANYRDHLEKLVEERTADLNLANAQLLHAEKLAAIGRLSASIAHEFNNPLYGIQSVIEGIKKNAALDENDLQLADLALSECRRVKSLIKSLQEFNRPSSEKKELTDLHLLLDDMLVMIKKDFKNAGVVIKKRYAADLPKVEMVADQLKQVFLNLLTNAKDAMGGGGAVTIATEDHGREVAVQIKDTGNGITAEDLPHVFEPFFSTKPEVKGTGLGLPISYGIIKGHGGKITVDTEPGKGTTFTVILPLPGTTDD